MKVGPDRQRSELHPERDSTKAYKTLCRICKGSYFGAGLRLEGFSGVSPGPFGFLIDHGRSDMVLTLVSILRLASLLCRRNDSRTDLNDRAMPESHNRPKFTR